MKVLIVDDHEITRISLNRLVSQEIETSEILEAADAAEAQRLAAANADIGLILLDLVLPDGNALDGFRELRDACPDALIVVVSMIEDRKTILHAIDLGASGYIPKTMSRDDMIKALHAVLEGEVYLPRTLLAIEEGAVPRSAPAASLAVLTHRQQEVLALVAQGKTNAQIAQALGMTDATVRLHVSGILKRLGLTNRTQAALYAAKAYGGN